MICYLYDKLSSNYYTDFNILIALCTGFFSLLFMLAQYHRSTDIALIILLLSSSLIPNLLATDRQFYDDSMHK